MVLIKTRKRFIKAIKEADIATLASYMKSDSKRWLTEVLDGDGSHALNLAVVHEKKDVLKLFIELGADTNHARNGYSPLISAIYRKQADMVKMLLDAKANPNLTDLNGRTPLDWVMSYKDMKNDMRCEIAKLLLDAGADPNIPTNGVLPLKYALASSTELVDLFLSRKPDVNHWYLLEPVLAKDHLQHYIKLVEAGLKPEERAVLHNAVINNSMKILQYGIEQGLDVNSKSNQGNLPLSLAIENKNLAAVKMLIRAGARTDLEDSQGYSAYEKAKKNSFIEAMSFLDSLKQARKPAKENMQAASPGPEKPEDNGQSPETWHRISDGKIAKKGVYPDIQKSLTEIFNFETQEQVTIIDDMTTKVQTVLPPRPFDDIKEEALNRAYDAYRTAGGKIDRAEALGGCRKNGFRQVFRKED